MGKVYDKRAALGNHQRQREQMDMILHGWRAVRGSGAFHEDFGVIGKTSTGQAYRYTKGMTVTALVNPEFCEWDELTTLRVHWIYKALKREKLL